MDPDYGHAMGYYPPTTVATPPLKRTRAKRSCDFCRQRKSKCDADTSTPCTNCKSWGYTCEFQTVRKKRGPPSVYVDNLEKRCKKMERLLTQLTNSTIKDLERSDFSPTHQRGLSDPCVVSDDTSSSSDDDDDDAQQQQQQQQQRPDSTTTILDRLAQLDIQDYDSLKYTGQSAGLFDSDALFSSSSSATPPPSTTKDETPVCIAWPGRQDMVLQRMADDQVMVVRTEKSALTGKVDTRLDVGLSLNSAFTHDDVSMATTARTTTAVPKPSKPLINQMIQLYFTHLHTSLPIINKHRFLHLYNTHSPALPKVLFQAVLAVTFRFASHHSLIPTTGHADHFFRKVMKHLRDPARSRLCHVQAGLLATLYLDMEDGDVESIQWHTLGKAIRMAQDLGLHRSCDQWHLLPASEIETRHRVFYACYALDRWIGARAGKPLTILDRDFDTTLPSMYEVSDHLQDTGGDKHQENTTTKPPVYRAFVLWVKLAEIVGRVLKALYAPSAKKANSNANLDDPMILVVFDRRLKHWYGLLEEQVDGMPLSLAQKVSLQIYYNTVILLLRRPFLSFSKYLTLEHLVLESRQVSLQVASDLTRLVQQNKQIKITEYHTSWFASSYLLPTCYIYAMFLSSLAHLTIVLHCPESDRRALLNSIHLIESHLQLPASRRALEILNMLVTLHNLKSVTTTTTTTTTIATAPMMIKTEDVDTLALHHHQPFYSHPAPPPPPPHDTISPYYPATTTELYQPIPPQPYFTQPAPPAPTVKGDEMPKTHWFQRYVNTSVVGGVPAEIHHEVQSDLSHHYDPSSFLSDMYTSSNFIQPSTSQVPPPPQPPNTISPSNLNLQDWQYYMTLHPPLSK